MSGYTQRSMSYLLANEFQDGQAAGSITPGDVRDFIGSVYTSVAGLNTQTGTVYSLVSGDAGFVVEMNNASSNTVTVPSTVFPVNTVVQITQIGAGATTLVGAAGVTLYAPTANANVVTRTQYSTLSLRQRASNAWVISGDII